MQISHTFHQVAPDVYYLTHYAETDRPVLGLITGKDRHLIIDAGASANHAEALFTKMQAHGLTSKETLLVATHWHWDHVFGAHHFPALFIAHEYTAAKLRELRQLEWSVTALDQRVQTGAEIAFCADMLKREYADLADIRIRLPEMQFTTKIQLDLGGIDCVIEYVGGDHVAGATVVHVVQPRVLFLGDCLYSNGYVTPPEYQPATLMQLVRKILSYRADIYVEGHNDPIAAPVFVQLLAAMHALAEYTLQTQGEQTVICQLFTEKYQRQLSNDEAEILMDLLHGFQRQHGNLQT